MSKQKNFCNKCGGEIKDGNIYCSACEPESFDNLETLAERAEQEMLGNFVLEV